MPPDKEKETNYASVVFQLQKKQEEMGKEMVDFKLMFNDIMHHITHLVSEGKDAKAQRDRIEDQTTKTNGKVKGLKSWQEGMIEWQLTVKEEMSKLMKGKILIIGILVGVGTTSGSLPSLVKMLIGFFK